MKFGFILLFLATLSCISIGAAKAGDVSCQTDILKPKMQASMVLEEHDKPAKLTVAETQIRLRNHHKNSTQEAAQETAQNNEQEAATESAKKSSPLGGLFDILLPSKLRNPAK